MSTTTAYSHISSASNAFYLAQTVQLRNDSSKQRDFSPQSRTQPLNNKAKSTSATAHHKNVKSLALERVQLPDVANNHFATARPTTTHSRPPLSGSLTERHREEWQKSMFAYGYKQPHHPRSLKSAQLPDLNAKLAAIPQQTIQAVSSLLGTVVPVSAKSKKCSSPYCSLPFIHSHLTKAQQQALTRKQHNNSARKRNSSAFDRPAVTVIMKTLSEEMKEAEEMKQQLEQRIKQQQEILKEKSHNDKSQANSLASTSKTVIDTATNNSTSPNSNSISATQLSSPESLSPAISSAASLSAGRSPRPNNSNSKTSPFKLDRQISRLHELLGVAASPINSPTAIASPETGLEVDEVNSGKLANAILATALAVSTVGSPAARGKALGPKKNSAADEEKAVKLKQWKAEKEAKEAAEREAKVAAEEAIKKERTRQLQARMAKEEEQRANAAQVEAESSAQRQAKVESERVATEQAKAAQRSAMIEARKAREQQAAVEAVEAERLRAAAERERAQQAAIAAANLQKKIAAGELSKVTTAEERELKAAEKKAKAEVRMAQRRIEQENLLEKTRSEREKRRDSVQKAYQSTQLSTQTNKFIKQRAEKRKLLQNEYNKAREVEEQNRKKAKTRRETNLKRLAALIGEDLVKKSTAEKLLAKAVLHDETVNINDRLRVINEELESKLLELTEATDADIVEELEELQRADKLEEERQAKLQEILMHEPSKEEAKETHLEAVPEMSEETINFTTRPKKVQESGLNTATNDSGDNSSQPSGHNSPNKGRSRRQTMNAPLDLSALNSGAVSPRAARSSNSISQLNLNRLQAVSTERERDTVNSSGNNSPPGEEEDFLDGVSEAVETAEDSENLDDLAALAHFPTLQALLSGFNTGEELPRKLAYCLRTLNSKAKQLLESSSIVARKQKIKKLVKLYRRRVALEQWHRDKLYQEEVARQKTAQREREIMARLDFALKKRVLSSLLAKRAARIADRKAKEVELGRSFSKEELERMRTGNMSNFMLFLRDNIKKEKEEEKIRAQKAKELSEKKKKEDQERDREAKLQERIEKLSKDKKAKELAEAEEKKVKEEKLNAVVQRQKTLVRGPSFMKSNGQSPLQRQNSTVGAVNGNSAESAEGGSSLSKPGLSRKVSTVPGKISE
jgi:hypothetical protein